MTLSNMYNYECDKLLNGVDLFRKLLPHEKNNSSIHNGEEGRFVENLVAEFLKKSLPMGLEVATGFVVNSRDTSVSSGQVDIVIYDNLNYAPLMKYGDAVVVHDKSLIGAVSIKKNLSRDQIKQEIESLSKIGSICGKNGQPKPYLSIFALDIRKLSSFEKTIDDVIKKLEESYPDRKNGWSANELIDDIIILNKFIVKKKEWKDSTKKEKEAKYIMCGGNGEHRNIYIQHLIHGIGKVINKRNGHLDSVLTSFPSINSSNKLEIALCTDDRPYQHS